MKGYDIDMQAEWDSSWLDSGNQSYLEDQFEIYLKNPAALSDQWRDYFKNLRNNSDSSSDVSHAEIKEYFRQLTSRPRSYNNPGVDSDVKLQDVALQKLKTAYRLLGHQQSNINPLQQGPLKQIPELDPSFYGLSSSNIDGNTISDLKKIYCGTIATEYLHITDAAERQWVQDNVENTVLNLSLDKAKKLQILDLVIAAEGLEKYLGSKYPGAKRYGLEGCDSLIVSLDEVISSGGNQGLQEIVIAMAHRGRLNVLVNLLGKMPSEIFDQFEEKNNIRVESGDVKYHQGFASDLQTEGGVVHVSLVFNPSHLEIVTPVAAGSVRSRQDRRADKGIDHVMYVSIHGDAAFSGQGIIMESLNMSGTRGFKIGGTLHIIINNQIGFTTSNPEDARSTLYCSDIGKMLAIPVFHVNADDPEAVLAITKLALNYRMKFNKDIIIDLVGYRRMGHNEADEPAATQPMMYKTIRAHPSVKQIYSEALVSDGICTAEQVTKLVEEYRNNLDSRDKVMVKRLADQLIP